MSLHQFKKASLNLLAVISLLLITACSTISDLKTDVSDKIFGREAADAPDPLVEIKETATAQLLWQAKVGPAEDFDFSQIGRAHV